MTKVVGFTALHYGREYLGWAIRSIIDHIDEYHVAYSAIGSHGHRTDRPCPETRDELLAIAQEAAGSKLHWHQGTWPYEGAQRESIYQYAPDADVILVLDADEIWGDGLARDVIEAATEEPFTRLRLPIIHYWRSFYRCVLHDLAYPIRVLCPKKQGLRLMTEFNLGHWAEDMTIHHMGYAQSPAITEYKQHTHGHKGEWDWSWFDNKFMPNAQKLVHPVGSEWWNPELVNPWDYLPSFMQSHPYANLEVIGEVREPAR